MRFFAVGQRIRAHECFETANILAAGYVVDANGIDILDAWWALRLPNWVYEFHNRERRYAMAQKILMRTRSSGFSIHLDFEIS